MRIASTIGRTARAAYRVALLLACTGLAMPVALAAAPPFPGATPDYKAWIMANLPGNPEGLAADANGTLYSSLWQTGRIVRLDGKGGSAVIAPTRCRCTTRKCPAGTSNCEPPRTATN